LVPNQARYQLRYCPKSEKPSVWTVFTGATGLEPAISGLTGQRDKPASLRPQCFYKLAKNGYLVKSFYGFQNPKKLINYPYYELF
jgi:hypothetical protein